MRIPVALLALLVIAAPASAELNAYYKGVDRRSGREVPATAQFSVDKAHVVLSMRGSTSWRMIFLAKEKLLRMVDDSGQKYFDVPEGGQTKAMLLEAQKQLAELPPEQRKVAGQMMRQALTSAANAPPPEYLWTTKRQTVVGHECTRVDIKQAGKKKAEYWGTTSPAFKISADERKTVVAMQPYLGSSDITASTAGSAVRAFQWDTSTEGYPLVMRCFEGDTTTVDLQIHSWDRKPLSKELFRIPYGYTKAEAR
jgi:hypothetical protein